MRIYQAKYTSDGYTRTAKKWACEFVDHRGIARRITLFTDRTASDEAARKIEKLVDRKRANEAPDRHLLAFVEGLPLRITTYLGRIGVLDAQRLTASRTLTEHTADFEAAIVAKGSTADHAAKTLARLRRVLTECGFARWTEIDPARIGRWLREEIERGSAAATVNYHAQAAQQFGRWMLRERRASENPLVNLPRFNVKADRRRERRALTGDEARMLLSATKSGPVRAGINGHERALIYSLALTTGLRANELRSLTRASFMLNADPPTVTVEAGSAKNRQRATLPLRADVAAQLEDHLALKLPNAPAFNIPKHWRSAEMIAEDLAAAKIPVTDADGRVMDFHGLRHTFISHLARAKVHPATAKALARHSDINLTMSIYTHSLREDEMEAVNRLPDLSWPIAEAATGTEGALSTGAPATTSPHAPVPKHAPNDESNRLASCLAELHGKQSISVDQHGPPAADTDTGRTPPNGPSEPVEAGGPAGIRTRNQGIMSPLL